VGVQLLGGGLTMALPFLTLYGKEILGFPASWVGLAIIAQTLGAVLGNLLWMPLGNRHGTRYVALGGLAGALTSVAYLACVGSPWAFSVGFALLGLSTSGIAVGFDGYILELGTEDLRPVLVALQETLLMPVYFMPVLGGLLVTCFGYRSLLVAAVALLAVAVFFGWRLCEPRTKDARCGPCASTSLETAETDGS
jgi:MFS family permease